MLQETVETHLKKENLRKESTIESDTRKDKKKKERKKMRDAAYLGSAAVGTSRRRDRGARWRANKRERK